MRMKKSFKANVFVALPCILAAMTLWVAAADPVKNSPSLRISVSGIALSATGAVMAAVCSTPEEFTGKRKPYLLLSAVPEGSNACIQADVLPQGTYAVKLYQDSNSNGTLDCNVFGVPKEPHGFSNDVDGRPDAKLWKKASFQVEGTNVTAISVLLN